MNKLKRAARKTGVREIALAGGVSANSGLRQCHQHREAEKQGWKLHLPAFQIYHR